MRRIAIVGAGAVGLSVAVQIAEAFNDLQVTLIAEKFSPDTTSDGAAGLFRFRYDGYEGISRDTVRSWLRSSWQQYDALAHSAESEQAGVQIISGYHLLNNPVKSHLEHEIVYSTRPLTTHELKMFPGESFSAGWFITTLMVEGRNYLPYLLKRFQSRGGLISQRRVSSFDELADYDVVVNCTGLGSRTLAADHTLYPSRGHVVRVRAPWLKHFVFAGDDSSCYIIPGAHSVIVGGTRVTNDEDPIVRIKDHTDIMERAYGVIPSLKKAKVEYDWVGFRPMREAPRVEMETRRIKNKDLKIVHNYGHGTFGVTLSWGTSTHAVQLVRKFL